ncbi:hypothetical protein VW29_00470 [Devosia limi DSM 17137]|uniref:Uncharacterized protein n=1 Tax=Devosia limi DSM 17137 TaxID=1121477 RepID=A0A0F5LX67_9HYPH|nr:hypothetical protein [Devosia limi]KKB86769.1 hypothetical protein VW29_00470 [Devosia limi DSM 17137]SHF33944.1 hypothetical protein SAMN02745223_02405 [Devosia limi DSM 17137]
MQENSLNRARALKPIVIAVGGEPQGVVVPNENGFRFLAVRLPAFAIDGQQFDTVEKARIAAMAAVRAHGGPAA